MRTAALCLALGTAVFLVYLNSFPGAFHYDDFPLLLENPRITDPNFDYGAFLEQYGGRPFSLWTFHWNFQRFGDHPFSYHLVSVGLHALVCLGVFLLVRQWSSDTFLAAGTALLFGLHPLQTQAVNYVWARSVLLMALFGVGALILWRRHPLLGLLSFQMAMWSRVEAVVFLLPLLGISRRHWPWPAFLSGLNVTAVAYCMWKYQPPEMAWTHADPLGYMALQPLAWARYLSLMLWPSGQTVEQRLPDLEVWSLLALLGAVIAAAGLAWRARRKDPVPGLAMIWPVLFLLPSAVVPNGDLLNESRAYLPVAGFSLAVVWAISRLSWRTPALKYGLLAIPLLFFSLATVERNEVWRDDVRLWQEAVVRSPGSVRAHYNLGVALVHAGDYRGSEGRFQTAARLDPGDDLSWAALAFCAEVREEMDLARFRYREALRRNPDNRYAREGFTRIEERRGG